MKWSKLDQKKYEGKNSTTSNSVVQEPGPEGQPPPEDCLACHAKRAGVWPQRGKRPPPQCCGAATFSGGSGSNSVLQSRSFFDRLRLQVLFSPAPAPFHIKIG